MSDYDKAMIGCLCGLGLLGGIAGMGYGLIHGLAPGVVVGHGLMGVAIGCGVMVWLIVCGAFGE